MKKPLTRCVNGCDAPPVSPSHVLCATCFDALDAKMHAALGLNHAPLPTVAEVAGSAPDLVPWREGERPLDPRYQLTDNEMAEIESGAIRALYVRLDKARRERDALVAHVRNLIKVADLIAVGCKCRRDCTCEVCRAGKAMEGYR